MDPTTDTASDGAASAGGEGTRSERLAARLAQRIAEGGLPAGSRLPSVRAAAERFGLAPSTVVTAYDLLQGRGLVEARPQRGFYVRAAGRPVPGAAAHAAAGGAGANAAPPLPLPSDATALIRGMFRAPVAASRAPLLGMGTLPEAWLDAPMLQRALRRVLAAPGVADTWLRYGEPAGDPALRAALVHRLADLGVPAAAQQVVTTTGASQALDLVARTLLAPGDAVLVDDPGWTVEFARLGRLGVRLLPVPRGPEGPDVEVLERLATTHRPRLYVTVSVLHNPTGGGLAPAVAHRVLRLAEAHDFHVLEDDTYGWLAPPHATRVAQLDALLSRTILVGGFAKILAPQWRVGFVAASPALAERLVDTKLLTTLTTPAPLEQAIALLMEQGALRRHAERVQQRLAVARARTEKLVHAAGMRLAAPARGLFGWVDTGIDTEQLARVLQPEGWLIAPGALFYARHGSDAGFARRGGEPASARSTLMRVNFACAADTRIWQRLKTLAKA